MGGVSACKQHLQWDQQWRSTLHTWEVSMQLKLHIFEANRHPFSPYSLIAAVKTYIADDHYVQPHWRSQLLRPALKIYMAVLVVHITVVVGVSSSTGAPASGGPIRYRHRPLQSHWWEEDLRPTPKIYRAHGLAIIRSTQSKYAVCYLNSDKRRRSMTLPLFRAHTWIRQRQQPRTTPPKKGKSLHIKTSNEDLQRIHILCTMKLGKMPFDFLLRKAGSMQRQKLKNQQWRSTVLLWHTSKPHQSIGTKFVVCCCFEPWKLGFSEGLLYTKGSTQTKIINTSSEDQQCVFVLLCASSGLKETVSLITII